MEAHSITDETSLNFKTSGNANPSKALNFKISIFNLQNIRIFLQIPDKGIRQPILNYHRQGIMVENISKGPI